MLTMQEVADYLRKSVATLRYWRHLATGPRGFKVGKEVRYWKSDVILWLLEQSEKDDRPQDPR